MYTTGKKDKHKIIINSDIKFGNTNIAGLQHKGIVEIDGQEQFVKLDDLKPTAGSWENRYDYRYSSISESIVSCLVRNMNQDQLNSVDYKFSVFNKDNKITTGTFSDNFLHEYEVEYILASGSTTNPNTSISIDDYVEEVHDVTNEQRMHQLLTIMKEHHIPEEEAKNFYLQQAAFDIITGNTDRLNNPSNIVFAYNVKTERGRPINMDYGRCLQLPLWSDLYEENYSFDFLDEDLPEWSKDVITRNKSMISSLTIEESISFLQQHGYQPLVIDIDQVHQDLNDLDKQLKESNIPCYKFAKAKIETLKAVLEKEIVKDLYIDKKELIELDISDLEVETNENSI